MERYKEIRENIRQEGLRNYIGAMIYMEIEEFEEALQENDLHEDFMDELVYAGVDVWMKEGAITLDELTRALWIGLDDYIHDKTGIKDAYEFIDYGLDKVL